MIFNLDTGKAYKLPTLNANYPANATVVFGENVELKVVISESGYPAECAYQWYLDGKAVSGATGSTYNFTSNTVGTVTAYCKVTNSAGTVTSRTATISVTGMYLYNTGDKCTAVIGDWISKDIPYGSGTATLQGRAYRPVYHDKYMDVISYGAGWCGVMHTKNKIDLSAFTSLKFKGTFPLFSANENNICVWTEIGSNGTDNIVASHSGKSSAGGSVSEITINVSNINEPCYIGFGGMGGGGSTNPIKVEQFWLE